LVSENISQELPSEAVLTSYQKFSKIYPKSSQAKLFAIIPDKLPEVMPSASQFRDRVGKKKFAKHNCQYVSSTQLPICFFTMVVSQ
jgi:hypothetical protein